VLTSAGGEPLMGSERTLENGEGFISRLVGHRSNIVIDLGPDSLLR
jgi:hypothetical protein